MKLDNGFFMIFDFLEWTHCLKEYDDLKGIKWEWQILDSQTVQSPVKGEKNR